MNAEVFESLLVAVRERRGASRRRQRPRATSTQPTAQMPAEMEEVNVRSVRALTELSQPKFAELLGIGLATLRNWEQGRRLPAGPARALLRAVKNDPVNVIKALGNLESKTK